jgi:hypothetical protein
MKRALVLTKCVWVVLLAALVMQPQAHAAGRRSVSGVVYFTNNTPPKGSVLVELYTRDMKRRVAARRLADPMTFAFEGVRPRKYILKLSWSRACDLSYEVDAGARAETSLEIIADVDCAHHNGEILPAPLSPR